MSRKTIDLTERNVHRYMVPFVELAGGITAFVEFLGTDRLKLYFHAESGSIMAAVLCQDREKHHSLLEFSEPGSDDMRNPARFLYQAEGCQPFTDYLEKSRGAMPMPLLASQEIRSLLEARETPKNRILH